MKRVIYKAYMDYEKEENWLNEMSAQGWALKKYSFCRYEFEKTPKNEYVYRIQFVDKSHLTPKNIEYIKFLEEGGVECVSKYFCWLFLRRKTSEGDFDIYSDYESKMKYLQKLNKFFNQMAWLECIIGGINILTGIMNLIETSKVGMVNLGCGIVITAIGILFIKLGRSTKKKIDKLEKEKF